MVWASIIARDITERERTKVVKDMLESERDQLLARLQLQMERMPIACLLADQNFHFTYWNPAAERLFAIPSGKWRESIQKDLQLSPRVRARIGRGFPAGPQRGYRRPKGFRRKTGGKTEKPIFCEWYNTPFHDSDGHFSGIMSMAIDITEQRKADEVQAQLAAILQQTTDAVIGSDLDNLIFSWNRGAEALFGYTFDEIVSQPQAILAPEDRKHESDEMRAIVMAGESISNFETVRMKKKRGLGGRFHHPVPDPRHKRENRGGFGHHPR